MSRESLFRVISILFVGASIYHAAVFFHPAFGVGGAHWRHAVFFLIDLVCAWFLLKRPAWFVFAFGALTLETLYGHGTHAWMMWRAEGQIDWLSIGVLIVVPLTMALLIENAMRRRSG
jgi:uncharacterized membrane protein